jgi:hypothetical protein
MTLANESEFHIPAFKVGIVGPTAIGKTSILSALLEEARSVLQGTTSIITPEGDTAARLDSTLRQMRTHMRGRKFRLGKGILGSTDLFTFKLGLHTSGLMSDRVLLEFLDYPGSLLTQPQRNPSLALEVDAFLQSSDVLIIPADAALLMTAQTESHDGIVGEISQIEAVERVVEKWATYRRKHALTGAIVITPLFCEKYLADNGGSRDEAEMLRTRVLDWYKPVLERAWEEHPDIDCSYCPIDTMGCVQLTRIQWGPPGAIVKNFKLRGKNPKLTPKGGGDVFTLIVRRYLQEIEQAQKTHMEEAEKDAVKTTKTANEDHGMLGNFWYYITGERDQWKQAAQAMSAESRKRAEALVELGKTLDSIRSLEPSGRISSVKRVPIVEGLQ